MPREPKSWFEKVAQNGFFSTSVNTRDVFLLWCCGQSGSQSLALRLFIKIEEIYATAIHVVESLS